MKAPKKQTDAETIKQLLAEGVRRDAAEMRFRKVLFWVIFLVMEFIALSRALAWCWPFHNFDFGIMALDFAIAAFISTIFFVKLRSAFNITNYNSNSESIYDRFANILNWTSGSIRWPRWPRF